MDSDSSIGDDDSESDDDEEEDRVQPYRPDEQERPKLTIYHPEFALTEIITKGVLDVFLQYIDRAMNTGYKDEEAKHLQEKGSTLPSSSPSGCSRRHRRRKLRSAKRHSRCD